MHCIVLTELVSSSEVLVAPGEKSHHSLVISTNKIDVLQPLANDILSEHTDLLALYLAVIVICIPISMLITNNLSVYVWKCSFFCLFCCAASRICTLRSSVLASSVANDSKFIIDFKVGKLFLKSHIPWGKTNMKGSQRNSSLSSWLQEKI